MAGTATKTSDCAASCVLFLVFIAIIYKLQCVGATTRGQLPASQHTKTAVDNILRQNTTINSMYRCDPWGNVSATQNIERHTLCIRRATKNTCFGLTSSSPSSSSSKTASSLGQARCQRCCCLLRPLTFRSLVSSRTMATAPPYLATATRQRSRCRSSSSAQSRS